MPARSLSPVHRIAPVRAEPWAGAAVSRHGLFGLSMLCIGRPANGEGLAIAAARSEGFP